MKDIFSLIAVLCLTAELVIGAIPEIKCLVRCGEFTNPSEHTAVDELCYFLEKMLGAPLSIISEEDYDGRLPALIVGRGCHARAALPDFSSLGPEEWAVLPRKDGSVIITGGPVHGVLYAALEFLEEYAGVRFLGVGALHIPRRNKLNFSHRPVLRGRPFFPYRLLSMRAYNTRQYDYFRRMRINGYDRAESGYSYTSGSPGNNHTFYLYAKKFSRQKKEYYTLTEDGRRLISRNASGPGQLCLSHPEVRREVKRILRSYVENDRRACAKIPGKPYPVIYDISQNDNPHRCRCPECRKLEERTGGPSGALIDFINEIAEDAESYAPDIIIQTFAYSYSQNPPAGKIHARKNVIINIALLGKEWGHGCRDTHRDIRHPNNRLPFQILCQWNKITGNIATWDYGKIYCENYPAPYTMVRGTAENMKFYAGLNVKSVYTESEITNIQELFLNFPSFYELQNYVFLKCSVNPNRPVEPLIDEFMIPYYGKAAPAMKEYLNYLENRMTEEKGFLNAMPPAAWKFLDLKFFEDAEKMLNRAELLVARDKIRLARVRREYCSVDAAHLNMQHRLHPDGQWAPPLCKEKILERYGQVMEEIEEMFFVPGSKHSPREVIHRKNQSILKQLKNPLPIPDFLHHCRIAGDFTVHHFDSSANAVVIQDPQAAGKQALYLGKAPRLGKNIHRKPLEFGIYCYLKNKQIFRKILSPQEIPQDCRYHWYKIPDIRLTPKTYMWLHWSWQLGTAPIRQAFNILDPDRKYDIWLSFKVEGPDYVSESTAENGVYLDRVIVTAIENQL